MKTTIRLLFILFIITPNLWASDWFSKGKDNQLILNVELFLSSTCPYCHKEDAFFKTIEPQYPWLRVQRHVINEDPKALKEFYQLLTEQKAKELGVPSVFFCNIRWKGFLSDQTTGNSILKALKYCKQQIETDGALTQKTIDNLNQQSYVTSLASLVAIIQPSYPLLFIALSDTLTPCTLFGFFIFLAFLFIQRNKRTQLVSGFLFILTLGLMHFFQQINPGIYDLWLPWLQIPAGLVGLFTLLLVGIAYKKSKISDILLYLESILLALMLGFFQQCTHWSYLFEQWVHQHHFSNLKILSYEVAYQLLYLLPFILLLLIYSQFIGFKQRLNPIGLLYMTFVGLLLIIYPTALSMFYVGSALFILIVLSIGIFGLTHRFRKVLK